MWKEMVKTPSGEVVMRHLYSGDKQVVIITRPIVSANKKYWEVEVVNREGVALTAKQWLTTKVAAEKYASKLASRGKIKNYR